MDLGLKGRRALVTGGGRGLGESIAQCLAREGARVSVVSRTQSDLEKVMKEMGGPDAGHFAISMDLEEQGSPIKLVAALEKNGFESIDMIVHNLGGTLGITDPGCSIEEWRRVFRLNLEVAVELNLLLLPQMQRQGWGRIVLISSIAGMENHGPIPYCSVKAALVAYGRSLGRTVAQSGVVVTTVLPGAVFTHEGYWDLAARHRPEHVKEYLEKRMAIGRFGVPAEVGNVVAFLCSEHASFCVGSVVPVDGGQGRGYFAQV